MNETKDEKDLLESGIEAENEGAAENDAESTGKKKKRKPPKAFKDQIIKTTEDAQKKGRNGGIKSGESKRIKRDARETIQYMLELAVKSPKIKQNLSDLSFQEEDFTNMAALQARLFAMAMAGDIEAYRTLMKMGGYEPEENRHERESINADKRKETELDAKMEALHYAPQGDTKLALSLNDEDGDSDVVIYMPAIADEKSCEFKEETPEGKSADES